MQEALDQQKISLLLFISGLENSNSIYPHETAKSQIINLIVEGVTDFWIISTLSTILRDVGRTALDERIVITPAGGATKVSYLATMLNRGKA